MKFEKTRSSRPLPKALRGGASALIIAALFAAIVPAFAQQGFEPVPAGSASKILPPELLSGPNHRVQEQVRSDGIVNI